MEPVVRVERLDELEVERQGRLRRRVLRRGRGRPESRPFGIGSDRRRSRVSGQQQTRLIIVAEILHLLFSFLADSSGCAVWWGWLA